MKKRLFLQLFAEPGDGGQEGNAGGGTGTQTTGAYTYEQLEEIASARAEKASRSALADFFRKQGMSEEDITSAIADYKQNREKAKPNVSVIEKERDEAKEELQRYKNEKTLSKKHVREEDMDYVLFKVSQMVDEKTDFVHAADKFLKENPRYAGQNTYRVSTAAKAGGGTSQTTNEQINDVIRSAIKRR